MATLPTYNAPAFKSLGSYNAPRWDEEKIDAITQKRAAPGLRELRNQVQRATGRTYGSPQVTKMTLRAALQGYGAGISKVIGESSQAAANEYGKQYGYQITNAQSTYAAEADAAKAYNEYAGDTAKTQFAGAMKGYETESESEKLDKEYDLWKQRYDYTRSSETAPAPTPAPAVPFRWTPLGRA